MHPRDALEAPAQSIVVSCVVRVRGVPLRVCMCVPRVAKDDDLQQHLLARRHREAPGSCTDNPTTHTSVIVRGPRRLQPAHAQVDKVQARCWQSPALAARRAAATLDLRPCSFTPNLPRRHARNRHVAPACSNSIAGVPPLRRAADKRSSTVRATARAGRSGPDVRRRSPPGCNAERHKPNAASLHLAPPAMTQRRRKSGPGASMLEAGQKSQKRRFLQPKHRFSEAFRFLFTKKSECCEF
jgi:hypothetical protein